MAELDPTQWQIEKTQDAPQGSELNPDEWKVQPASPLADAAQRLGVTQEQAEFSLARHADLNAAAGLAPDEDSRLRWSLEKALGVNSELAAKVQYLHNQKGIPAPDPAQIMRNPQEYQKWDQAVRLHQHVTQKDDKGRPLFPALFKHMSDPTTAALLKDDVDPASRLEALLTYDYGGKFSQYGWRFKEGAKNIPAALASLADTMAEANTQKAEASADELAKKLALLNPTDADRAEALLLQMQVKDATRAATTSKYTQRATKALLELMPKANPLPADEVKWDSSHPLSSAAAYAEMYAGDVVENAPQLLATMGAAYLTRGQALRAGATAASAARVGQITAMAGTTAYIAGAKTQELRDKVGAQLALEAGLRDGLAQGAMEAIPLGRFFTKMGANTGRQAVVKAALQLGIEQGGMEVLQKLPESWTTKWAEEAAKGGSTGEIFDRTWARTDLTDDLKQGVYEGLVVLPMTFLFGVGAMAHAHQKGIQAQKAVETLKVMAGIADETKIKTNNPTVLEALANTALEHAGDQGVKTVQVSPAALETLFQGDQAGLNEALEKLAITDEYAQAKIADREVEVSVPKMLTVLNAEQVGALAEDIRPGPDMPTPREVKETAKQRVELQNQALALLKKEGAKVLPAQLQNLREQWLREGTFQGRKATAKEVDSNIALEWAAAQQAAKRWGITPEQWLQTRIGDVNVAADQNVQPAEGAIYEGAPKEPVFQTEDPLTKNEAAPWVEEEVSLPYNGKDVAFKAGPVLGELNQRETTLAALLKCLTGGAA